MKKLFVVLAMALGLIAAVGSPASAATHNFGPIVQIGTVLTPGLQEAVHVPAVNGSGVHGDVLMKQRFGVFTMTGKAAGFKLTKGQVAVSVEYNLAKCVLDGSETLADFITVVWLPTGNGTAKALPLPKSTTDVELTDVNAVSIRVIDVAVSPTLLFTQLKAGNVKSLNAVPTAAPAKACAVRK